jgi:phytol kinase
MTQSFRKEILRKLFHLMEIPLLLGYSVARYFWSEQGAIIILTAVLLILLEIEYVRLEVKPKLPRALDLFRAKEKNNVTGTFFFISATIIAVSAFDYGIAMLALFLTVFGDLVSALVGIRFGKHKIFKRKSWEGFAAGLATNVFVGYLFFPELPVLFLSMAIVASVVELMTNKLDDNITVPLFAGFTGQMIVYFFAYEIIDFPGPLLDLLRFFE